MDEVRDNEPMHMALAILRMMRPYRVLGAEKVRLGRLFDGGYVMLDRFEDVEAAYSLGINDDVSWDLDVAARGIALYQYDHTIERLPADHELFHWERIGIAASPWREERLQTLPNLLLNNGHETSRALILKCDIEGAEWPVFGAMPSRVVGQFQQIVMEVHRLNEIGNMGFANEVRAALRSLLITHRVVHVHGNNFAGWAIVGGVPVPESLELTFVRRDLGEFVVSDEVFPTPLDMPCHSKWADMYLGRFDYG